MLKTVPIFSEGQRVARRSQGKAPTARDQGGKEKAHFIPEQGLGWGGAEHGKQFDQANMHSLATKPGNRVYPVERLTPDEDSQEAGQAQVGGG